MVTLTYPIEVCSVDGINALLERGAGACRDVRPRGARIRFRASGLGSCLRREVYGQMDIEQDTDVYVPDYELAAAQGSAIHEHVQRWLVSAGIVYEWPGVGPAIEMQLTDACSPDDRAILDRIPFDGHIDAVIEYNGTLAILDIKTVSSKVLGNGGFIDTVVLRKAAGYAPQLSAYMRFWQAHDGRRAREAYVLMVSRDDTSRRMLFRIPYDERAFAADWERVERAAAAVKAGSVPVAEPERGVCRFCAYQLRCSADG